MLAQNRDDRSSTTRLPLTFTTISSSNTTLGAKHMKNPRKITVEKLMFYFFFLRTEHIGLEATIYLSLSLPGFCGNFCLPFPIKGGKISSQKCCVTLLTISLPDVEPHIFKRQSDIQPCDNCCFLLPPQRISLRHNKKVLRESNPLWRGYCTAYPPPHLWNRFLLSLSLFSQPNPLPPSVFQFCFLSDTEEKWKHGGDFRVGSRAHAYTHQ